MQQRTSAFLARRLFRVRERTGNDWSLALESCGMLVASLGCGAFDACHTYKDQSQAFQGGSGRRVVLGQSRSQRVVRRIDGQTSAMLLEHFAGWRMSRSSQITEDIFDTCRWSGSGNSTLTVMTFRRALVRRRLERPASSHSQKSVSANFPVVQEFGRFREVKWTALFH